MSTYHFWKTFARYVSYLLLLLIILFVGIIVAFSLEVNHEIEETAKKQTESVQHAIELKEEVDADQYFFIMDNDDIVENHTPFTQHALRNEWLNQGPPPVTIEAQKGVFHLSTANLSQQQTLYSLTNVKDFYETKMFLYRILAVGFVFAFILMIVMAYYLARRPVVVYEQLMEAQQMFVQNASHEMKTPLASLLLGLQYLEMTDKAHLSKEGQRTLSQMKTEMTYMQQLVETMLQDNIDRRKVETIDISKVFDETITTIGHVYHSKIQKSYPTPLNFAIHPLHIKQMMNILLENAFIHNANDVQVHVSAFQTINGIQITVSDNGKGMRQDEQGKIFQRFYKVDKNKKGSGIGLALLKNLVHQYGGTIEVRSQLGKGAKFIIKL